MFRKPLTAFGVGLYKSGATGRLRPGSSLQIAGSLFSTSSISYNSQQIKSFYELFPQNFPNGGPPKDSFLINERQLRREYRSLQSQHHPDIVIGSSAFKVDDDLTSENKVSSIINKGYVTLRNPYSRIAHFIELYHPDHLDITQDDVAKSLIATLQSTESSLEYKEMLMLVLEAHEHLEMATNEDDLDDLSRENDERIEESEVKLDQLLKYDPINWDALMIEAIRLKYWVNIQNGIKEWEPGKPVHLTH